MQGRYGVPDVGLFDATGALNTPGSLPAGERVTLPFFGKSPVAERQSARGYAPARSRAERESARAQRSARMSSRRSSRGSARSSARSSARGGGYVPAAAGPKHGRRSSWEQRDGFVVHPRFRSRSEMMEFRRESMMPHHTFDVDGDGVVSSEDFKLAQAFDINKDGELQLDERHDLRKDMVNTLITKYRRLPHANSEEAEQMIRRFTKDIDTTVNASDFIHNYNKLHSQTMVQNTHDSTQMHEATQPIIVAERQSIADAFQEFDVNGDAVIDHDEFRQGVKALVRGMDDATVDELITIVDKDGDGEIDYLEFAKQCTDPGHGRARDVLDQVTEGMASSRGAAQREFDRVDTYRDDNKALFEDKRYSGFQTRGALFKSRRDNQRQFCAKQLKAKLTPVLKLS